MVFFRPKPWVNPFGKMSNSRLFVLLFFFCLEKRFSFLEYHKRESSGLHCLKKKGGKMAIFSPKPWVNPFGKM